VTVTGLPAGGTITANDRPQRGTTFELGPGQYRLRMSAAGYQPATAEVSVVAGEAYQVAFQAVRMLTSTAAQPQPTRPATQPAATPPVTSGNAGGAGAPPDAAGAALGLLRIAIQGGFATMTIDGVGKGQAARLDEALLPGLHQIRFERDGYVTVDTTVTIARGDTMVLRVRLQPRS
jgi:hypothetical protein